MFFPSTASSSCKGNTGLFLSAWVGSFCILGMPSTDPTAPTELQGWDGSLVSTLGHVPLFWVLQKPWRSKLWSWLLLGSADRFWRNWAENQSMWVIASLCWVAGCCKTTQGFGCFPARWNVSLVRVLSHFSQERVAPGSWRSDQRLCTLGSRGQPRAGTSRAYGNGVLQCRWGDCQVFNGKLTDG